MIKHINHQNFLTTPFVAEKYWNLYNIQNSQMVMLEIEDGNIILDYVDYSSGNPLMDRDCNIALEQQPSDLAIYEEGITGSGKFDPNTDEQNQNGTYKRLIHNQIRTSFYNKYNNPIEIFGVENLDFPLSNTLRNLSDSFRMFSIPRSIFGEKIIPNSVIITDNTLDDNVNILDDGYQNLVAKTNLFSKIQEVRILGNIILSGTSSYECPVYSNYIETSPYNTASINVGFSYGEMLNLPPWVDGGTSSVAFYTGSLINIITILSCSTVPITNSLAFYTGSCDNLIYITNGNDTASIIATFYTGSCNIFAYPVYGREDTGSMTLTFYSGSIHNEIYPANTGQESGSITVGFLNGSLT